MALKMLELDEDLEEKVISVIKFTTMSVPGSINEEILRRTNKCYFNHSTLLKAQISLVNYHHSLNIVKNWGDGLRPLKIKS